MRIFAAADKVIGMKLREQFHEKTESPIIPLTFVQVHSVNTT